MDYALSDKELRELWFKKTGLPLNYIDYGSLEHRGLPRESFVLFYPLKRIDKMGGGSVDMGHYICVIQHPDTIYVYDSYGNLPDGIKNTMTQDQRHKIYGGQTNTLLQLLLDSGKNVDYSPYTHQSKKRGIATCGRHALSRLYNSDLTNDEYNRVLKKASGKTSKDRFMMKYWS